MSNQSKGINTFQRYLSVWVLLCMAIGVLIGHFIPAIPATLGKFQISGISIPIAVLIWVMIYPMMMKVDFQSVKQIGKNPKGLLVTWVTNWLIKPFTMYGIAYLFLFVIFKTFISPGLATEYLAGAVLLGAAPCTAMVFVWSTLTKGNPAYTVVQVATNDLIILVAFVPIVKFLLGVSNVAVPYSTLFVSIFLFVVIPLVGGILTRITVTKQRGADYFETTFVHKFDNATTIGLLLTLVIIFSSQAEVILSNPLHIVLIAVPLTIQTFLIFFIAYGASKLLKLPHDRKEHLAFGIQRVYGLLLKIDWNVLVLELPDILEAVEGVSGKSADGFGDDHVDVSGHALLDHAVELITFFGVGTGDAVIRKNASQLPFRILLNVLGVVCDLCLVACSLFFRIRADAAVSCDTELRLFAFLD